MEAERLGIGIQLVAAGGYTELQKQVDQVENLSQQNVDSRKPSRNSRARSTSWPSSGETPAKTCN
jgi:hypothetical protein